jgi:DNA-binding transcriptional LysR family regulator
MFDLTRLRLLRELSRRGTMTAVAEACGMTSSAVSQHLATLEREVRGTLLERIGRRVRLTAEGQRLAAHAEVIVLAMEAAARDMRTALDAPAGVLQVAAFATYARARLLPAVSHLRTRHPDLEVVICELEPIDSLEAVRDGRCDVAITFAYSLVPRRLPPGLVGQPLAEEPIQLVLPPRLAHLADPIDMAILAEEAWIVGARQTDDRELAARACALAGFAPRMTHAIQDYGLVLDMVAADLGVALVPALALDAPSAGGVVARTPAGPGLSRRIEAVTRPALAASPGVRALFEALGGPGPSA